MTTPTTHPPDPKLVLATLIDAEADLAALERSVRRHLPSFESTTLAKVRNLIAQLKGEQL